MEFYRTLQTIDVGVGVKLGLTKEQAYPRLDKLKPGKKDIFTVTKPGVEFKRGEIIGFVDVPKGYPLEPVYAEEKKT